MFVSLINISGSESFLKSLIKFEIDSLPRNTAHNAIKKQRKIRQNVETNDRINKITKMISTQLSQRRINPDFRSKLCIAQTPFFKERTRIYTRNTVVLIF